MRRSRARARPARRPHGVGRATGRLRTRPLRVDPEPKRHADRTPPARSSATALSTPPLIATATRSPSGAAEAAGPSAAASASTTSSSPSTAAASNSVSPARRSERPSASASTMRSGARGAARPPSRRSRGRVAEELGHATEASRKGRVRGLLPSRRPCGGSSLARMGRRPRRPTRGARRVSSRVAVAVHSGRSPSRGTAPARVNLDRASSKDRGDVARTRLTSARSPAVWFLNTTPGAWEATIASTSCAFHAIVVPRDHVLERSRGVRVAHDGNFVLHPAADHPLRANLDTPGGCLADCRGCRLRRGLPRFWCWFQLVEAARTGSSTRGAYRVNAQRSSRTSSRSRRRASRGVRSSWRPWPTGRWATTCVNARRPPYSTKIRAPHGSVGCRTPCVCGRTTQSQPDRLRSPAGCRRDTGQHG